VLRVAAASFLVVLAAAAWSARARAADLTVTGEEKGASSRVNKRDLEERLPRSAPDALRWEPGVFVQQTGHGQASPFIRGRTGQQTVLLFDGIRLNNSTFRQGPNQYLFTVDARSMRAIEVLRGGASTLYGSDALGGVVNALPLEPMLDDTRDHVFRPRAALRFGSADGEFSERFQVDAQFSPSFQVLAGVGFRRVGRLRSGGPVRSPTTGQPAHVPRFEDDGKTMLGTGFRELTSDVRVAYRLSDTSRILAAAYLYRQYDSPRTDQCPPAFAPPSECLVYEEQFRTMAYLAYEGALGPSTTRLTLSYQRQHERRRRGRLTLLSEVSGRDDVDTLGVTASVNLAKILTVGGDGYFDSLRSIAWLRFTDTGRVIPDTRGQYMTGSRYGTGGLFAQAGTTLAKVLDVRGGARLGLVRASSPGDGESGTAAVDKTWLTHAAFVTAEWRFAKNLAWIVGYDRSFRAPNLDDLTSRQQTGPGFQLENAGLRPETSDTFEAGLRARTDWLLLEGWLFRSRVNNALTRVVRGDEACPPNTPACPSSWTRYQLMNATGVSTIDGAELAARVRLPRDVTLRATVAYAYGYGPDAQSGREVPLSRVSPLNGTFEARWAPLPRVWTAAGLRWATAQTRLAPSDRSDARIPEGGTPGFAVVDLRVGLRVERNFLVTLILENLGDAAYRYHGSSINGPGRSVLLAVESGL